MFCVNLTGLEGGVTGVHPDGCHEGDMYFADSRGLQVGNRTVGCVGAFVRDELWPPRALRRTSSNSETSDKRLLIHL